MIDKRANDYVITYTTSAGSFNVTQAMAVVPSFEYELLAPDQKPRMHSGHACSIDDSINQVAVGAPRETRPVNEVQTITSLGATDAIVNEIQTIQTTAAHVNEIQTITLSIDSPGKFERQGDPTTGVQTIPTFAITWDGIGPLNNIPFDVDATQLKRMLEDFFMLHHIGLLSVTRTVAGLGYKWDVEFLDLRGEVPMMSVDGSGLSIVGAHYNPKVEVEEFRPSTQIAGTFTLSLPDIRHHGNNQLISAAKTTPAIPYDATPEQVQQTIATHLWSLTPVLVSRSLPDKQRGYTWSVTFYSDFDHYDVPEMVSGNSLTGHPSRVIVRTLTEGMAPPSGNFTVTFRQSTTTDISYAATSDQMKQALEGIPTINTVSVSRRSLSRGRSFIWTITFEDVSHPILNGHRRDRSSDTYSFHKPKSGNLEPLIVDQSNMLGSSIAVSVEALTYQSQNFYVCDDPSTNCAKRRKSPLVYGSSGQFAGAVYMYSRTEELWNHQQKLYGTDTSEYDEFGYSLNLRNSELVVGAPGKNIAGLREKQTLVCTASSGSFMLVHDGKSSKPIPFGSTVAQLEEIIEEMNAFVDVTVTTSGDIADAICHASSPPTISIQFEEVDGDIAQLGKNTDALTGTIVITDNVVQGTYDGQEYQSGAAYVFEYSSSTWTQHSRIQPSDLESGKRFGHAISYNGDTIAVGAPHDSLRGHHAGAVYLFKKSTNVWTQTQKLTMSDSFCGLNCPNPQNYPKRKFGFSVASSGNILVIGESWVNDNHVTQSIPETVHVFKRLDGSSLFLPFDKLRPNDPHTNQNFGFSVAISSTTIVVGAPGDSASRQNQGAAYIFYEDSGNANHFKQHEKLVGTTTSDLDRFGRVVAIESDTMLVNAHPEFNGELVPRKVVQEIHSTATSAISGTFRLGWRQRPTVKNQDLNVFPTREKNVYHIPIGTVVSVKRAHDNRYHSGRVVKSPGVLANSNDRYNVQYDDGSWEYDLLRENIQVVMDETDTFVSIETTDMSHDITASDLRVELMASLGTLEVDVERSVADANGGYAWTVTFTARSEGEEIQLFKPIYDIRPYGGLHGDNVNVNVKYLNRPTPPMVGTSFLYTRSGQQWTEQMLLRPKSSQYGDLFGLSCADISTAYSVVGSPNRDPVVSGKNGGAAYVFSLGFLNLKFSAKVYTVSEHAEKFAATVLRCNPSCHHGDKTSSERIFTMVGDGEGSGLETLTRERPSLRTHSICPLRQGCMSTATGRSDCHLRADANYPAYNFKKGECMWIPSNSDVMFPSQFDFHALSDYAPDYAECELGANVASKTFNVIFNDDTILEVPDEFINLRLLGPGIEPSFAGDYWATLVIQDDGDGGLGSEHQYAVFQDPTNKVESQFGTTLDVGTDIAVVGAAGHATNEGIVYVYTLTSGVWTLQRNLTSPSKTQNEYFGSAVSISTKWIAVGAVGTSKCFIFDRDTMTLNATLTRTSPYVQTNLQRQFAGQRSVSVYGDYVVVGAIGDEAVYVYQYSSQNYQWAFMQKIQASDFHSVTKLDILYISRSEFGSAVSIWDDTIVVGAPKADNAYNSNQHDWYGRPTEKSFGRGAVYVFIYRNNAWQEQKILTPGDKAPRKRFGYALDLDKDQLIVGAPGDELMPRTTWGFETGSLLGWTATGTAFDHQPTYLDNSAQRNVYSRTVSFGVQVAGPTGEGGFIISPAHTGSPSPSIPGPGQVDGIPSTLAQRRPAFSYNQHVKTETLTTAPYTDQDLIDFHRDHDEHILSGRPHEKYEYEHQLRSHTFTEQPNDPENAKIVGFYYIGTYEKRPTNETAAGTIQGDAPQGTLTSDPFVIMGSEITFLIGGGCNIKTEFVELIVDGIGDMFAGRKNPNIGGYDRGNEPQRTFRATGRCNEMMRRVRWNVTKYFGQTAQIRIADLSSKYWAHINVDDFQFDWEPHGETVDYWARNCGNQGLRSTSCGSKSSGSAYVFRRRSNTSKVTVNGIDFYNPCSQVCGPDGCVFTNPVDRWPCQWDEQRKLVASDRRPGDGFGMAVAADDTKGHAIVGAPYSRTVDQYNQNAFNGFRADTRVTGGFERINTGAVYIFTRTPEQRDGQGVLIRHPLWMNSEHSKTYAPERLYGSMMGSAVAISGWTAMTSAPVEPSLSSDLITSRITLPKIMLVDTKFQHLRFSQEEYYIIEDAVITTDPDAVDIELQRTGDVTEKLVVGYATSDITAIGISPGMAASCYTSWSRDRGECGDYHQTWGYITFEPGVVSQSFSIQIVNDQCQEHYQEYFKIQLFIPGGGPLLGEQYQTIVRIDDDDGAIPISAATCKRTVANYALNDQTYRYR
eukprot:g1234.t1